MSRYSEVETHPKTHQEYRHAPRWQERVSVDDALRHCTSGTASLLATKDLPCRQVPFTPELHNGLHRSLHPASRSILSTLNSVGHPQQIGLHAAQTRMRRERPHPFPPGASPGWAAGSEEQTSEIQSHFKFLLPLFLSKKKNTTPTYLSITRC